MAKRKTTIGQMRELVKVLSVTDSPYGGFSVNRIFTEQYQIRARVLTVEGGTKERDGIGAWRGEYTHTFITRAGITIDTSNLLEWEEGIYSVMGVEKLAPTIDDPKTRLIKIYAVLSNKADTYKDPAPEQTQEWVDQRIAHDPNVWSDQ